MVEAQSVIVKMYQYLRMSQSTVFLSDTIGSLNNPETLDKPTVVFQLSHKIVFCQPSTDDMDAILRLSHTRASSTSTVK